MAVAAALCSARPLARAVQVLDVCVAFDNGSGLPLPTPAVETHVAAVGSSDGGSGPFAGLMLTLVVIGLGFVLFRRGNSGTRGSQAEPAARHQASMNPSYGQVLQRA